MKKVMRNKNVIAVVGVVVLAMALLATGVVASDPPDVGDPPVESKISYQGQLTDSAGNPLNGTYDMWFTFYDAVSGGSQVGSTITRNDVTVTNGLFTVKLDVNQSGFNGQGLWLEVKVGSETLSPRQEILPVPYALSLKPGAEIEGEVPNDAVLSITNISDSGNVIDVLASGGHAKGIFSQATGNYGVGGMFIASGTAGKGILAKGEEYAADLYGKVIIRSYPNGTPVMELGEGLDYAEGFDVSDKKDISPGSVLIIDPDNPGKLALSDTPYDTKVAGIVAGAEGIGSGVRLGSDQFDYDVALAGRVYCNVDATDAGVEPGDLLTTSAIPGYAMKVTDYGHAQGAILGKAMEGLEKGQTGQILVLVTLQ